MAISIQAMNGTKSIKTLRLRGHLHNQEVFMLIDSGSTHSFISETAAAAVPNWQLLDHSVRVQVANGSTILCTHQLVDQTWGCQGHTFLTTMKIIPLSGYDIVLGMDWLKLHSPMNVHWEEFWIQLPVQGRLVTLQGVNSATSMGPPISLHQVQALSKTDSILYAVQL